MFFGNRNPDGEKPDQGVQESIHQYQKELKDRTSTSQSNRLKQFWEELDPDKKRRLTIVSVVVIVVLVSLLGYKAKHGSKRERLKKPKAGVEHEIKLDSGLMEKSLYTRAFDVINEQNKEIESLRKELQELKNAPPKVVMAPPPPSDESPEPAGGKPEDERGKKKPRVSYPPPPSRPRAVPPPPPEKEQETVKVLGGIEIAKNRALPKESKTEAKKSKKKRQIYLPPSFMEATLLSGVAARTTSAAKGNPLPILMRIKDLAVLPNKVKANLKGCFVIGEAIGNLAAERVDVRLLTLSCVAKNGKAVIDQSVKGFVIDSDGKVGLSAKVVAKMGMHIARAAWVGFLGGIGEAVEASSLNTTFSPTVGTTTQIWSDTDTQTVAKAGIGKGISNAAKELQKFYLQLAEQTLPVLEVGPTKTVTVVISEGVGLEIKKYKIAEG